MIIFLSCPPPHKELVLVEWWFFFFKEKNDKIMYLSRWKNCGFQLAQFVKSFFFFFFFFLKKIVKSLIAE